MALTRKLLPMLVPKRATEPGLDWDVPDAVKHPVTHPYFTTREKDTFKSLGVDLDKDSYIKYNDIVNKMLKDPQRRFTAHWENEAKVPYLMITSAEGKSLFAISYKNPRSVAIKAEYIKNKGLAGATLWEYGNDKNNRLAHQLAETLAISPLNKECQQAMLASPCHQ